MTTSPIEPVPDDQLLVAEAQWRSRGWKAGARFLASLSIVRVEEIIRRANTAVLEPHGLTHTRHEALAVLYFSRNGELPLVKLSERLLLHPTSITSTVDVLERLGLVDRVPHPTDRRTTLARITVDGRRVMEASSQAMAESAFGVGSLTDAEACQLVALLGKVRKAAGDVVG